MKKMNKLFAFFLHLSVLICMFCTMVAFAGTDPSNTFSLGDSSNSTNKVFRAKTGSGNRDFRYNTSLFRWEFSNDGVSYNSVGSTPLTTKGDLFTFSTVNDRLPVGTSGQILSADPAESTGLKWISPTSSSGFATISGGNSSGTFGSYNCQTFTSSGTLTVSAGGSVMFLLVGGGGGGGHGGGGGGGVIDHYWEDLNLAVGSYPVTIGAGGVGVGAQTATRGNVGGNTTFAGFTAYGGGGGGVGNIGPGQQVSGGNGGSGGGGSANGSDGAGAGGTGTFNKPEVQGFAGAASVGVSGGCYNSSGGGGAGAIGLQGTGCSGGGGGAGLRSVIATLIAGGTPTYYGGGGSGGRGNNGGVCTGSVPAGGIGGGGGGADTTAGTANTGGGGSGGCTATNTLGGNGGSGRAVICARISGS